MALRRCTDVPYIPDCIESGDETAQVLDLQDMQQGLPDVQQPQQQQQPRRRCHRAGRQVLEACERREREREERNNRREAAKVQPPTDDDLRLPAPAEPTPPPPSARKVARVAPFVREQFPTIGPMGRGQMLRSMLNAPGLLPPLQLGPR